MSFRLESLKVTLIITKIPLFCITGDSVFRPRNIVTKLYIGVYTQ